MARPVMRAGHSHFATHTRRYAKREKLQFATEMRRNPTPGEAIMWRLLRGGRLGFKFRRQAILRGYIVDFWCPKTRLVVEIDGGYHNTPKQQQWDRDRDAALARLNIETLRLREEDVTSNPEAATIRIFQVACQRLRKLEAERRQKAGVASIEAAC